MVKGKNEISSPIIGKGKEIPPRILQKPIVKNGIISPVINKPVEIKEGK